MSTPTAPGRGAPVARVLMWAGVIVVAGAAAVLSFTALADLALMCGFGRRLAWLLPVTIDVGTALGSLVWLGRWAPGSARRYARGLALVLLGGSVAGNALGHGLGAYGARPHWLVVVAVSAVAPVVLAAVVHLVVLATHPVAAAGDAVAGPVGDEPDHARPVPGQSPAAASQLDLDLLAELTGIGDHDPDRSGEADQSDAKPDHADQRPLTSSARDEEIVADLREWAVDEGRPISRDRVMRGYGIGATRARRLRDGLRWPDRSDQQAGRSADRSGQARDGDGEVTWVSKLVELWRYVVFAFRPATSRTADRSGKRGPTGRRPAAGRNPWPRCTGCRRRYDPAVDESALPDICARCGPNRPVPGEKDQGRGGGEWR